MGRITALKDNVKGDHEDSFAVSRKRWGSVPNFYRTLAHSPKALHHIMELSYELRKRWREDPERLRLMQLAIVKPSMMNQCLI